MKVAGALRIPSDLLRRLAEAAKDERVPVGRHASLCITAAARLYSIDTMTTAMPACRVSGFCRAEIYLSIDVEELIVVSGAAMSRDLSLDAQLVAILDAATPPPVVVRRPQPGDKPSNATQKAALARRRPFDPAYYASRAILPSTPSRVTTGEMFGDPGCGRSYWSRHG